MDDNDHSRREFLRGLGATGSVGVMSSLTTQGTDLPRPADTARQLTVDPGSLVITATDLSTDFEETETTGQPPLLKQLQAEDSRFGDAATAVTGFVAEGDQTIPELVICSCAVVCQEEIAPTAVVAPGTRCMEALSEAYNDEVPDWLTTVSQEVKADTVMWRLDLHRDVASDDEVRTSPSLIASDFLFLQYSRNVLVGTVAFGPKDHESTRRDEVLRLGRIQRSRLERGV